MAGLLKRIKAHEGLRLQKYRDTAGHWTIGYGHKIRDNENFDYGITKEEATDIFLTDIEKAIEQFRVIELDLDLWLNDARRGVCVEMIFQMGVAGFKGFKKMITALIREDWENAADEMLDSLWAQQTPERCKKLSKMMRDGA